MDIKKIKLNLSHKKADGYNIVISTFNINNRSGKPRVFKIIQTDQL